MRISEQLFFHPSKFPIALGLWWFAWTIAPTVRGVHWVLPTLPLVLVGYALNEFDTVLLGYIVDSYLTYSASGLAAVQFVRAIMAGTFPLFTHQMIRNLGANIAMTLLAVIATFFCVAPPLFLYYGKRIRQHSKFAEQSLKMEVEMEMEDKGLGNA